MQQFCRPSDLSRDSVGSFQVHHEYRTVHDISACLAPEYFWPAKSNLRIGDSISIVQYEDVDLNHREKPVVAFATVRVVALERGSIKVHLDGDIVLIDAAHEAPNMAGSGLSARHMGRGMYNVFDQSGGVVAKGLEKARATAIVDGREAIPA